VTSAATLRAELVASQAEFHELLDLVAPNSWRQPSRNPAWTNGQLLFHIALGFFLLIPLVRIMRVFSALPKGASRAFARCLNLGTPIFNWINAIGPRVGARVLNAKRLGSTFDSVCRKNLAAIDAMRPEDWGRGMHYPTRWEPRFADFMTVESLFRYPAVHMRHHRAQIAASIAR
jgi:hypothetical protein